jgi:hypothetical protein
MKLGLKENQSILEEMINRASEMGINLENNKIFIKDLDSI